MIINHNIYTYIYIYIYGCGEAARRTTMYTCHILIVARDTFNEMTVLCSVISYTWHWAAGKTQL
jgi:hypothetical protein